MGGGSWKSDDWTGYSSARNYASKTPDEVINTTKVDNEFLPTNFKGGRRESRDSDDNPNSTAIIVAGDVTGSMGRLGGTLIKEGMAKFAEMLYDPDRRPVSNPHIMGMAIGDVTCDTVPIQCTQFEADIRIIQQFEQLYVEGRGGGNDSETYHGPWLVGAMMTDIDCFEKRAIKGVLFTYGDEKTPPPITVDEAKRFFGLTLQQDLSAEELLTMVSRTYDVYHLMIMQGDHARTDPQGVKKSWANLMGQRAIEVVDSTKLAEIMIGILEVTRKGTDKVTVAASFSKGTDIVVATAIDKLVPMKGGVAGGVVAI